MENEEVKQPREEEEATGKDSLVAALAALAGTSLFSMRGAPITINVHVGDKTVYYGTTNATPV